MSWQDGYRKAVLDAIAQHGRPLDPNASYYGWSDYKAVREWYGSSWGDSTAGPDHTAHGLDYDACGDVVEDSWAEFMGTFYEGDTTQHGMRAEIVCKCGAFRHVFRWEGNAGEIISVIANDALKRPTTED